MCVWFVLSLRICSLIILDFECVEKNNFLSSDKRITLLIEK